MSEGLVLLSAFAATQIEFWQVVKEFPGYDVSSNGRLRNRKGVIFRARQRDRYGYIEIRLSVRGKKHWRRLHTLVARAWVKNPEELPEVNHLTGLKTDNRAGNLEWITQTGNYEHAVQNGLIRKGALLSGREPEIALLETVYEGYVRAGETLTTQEQGQVLTLVGSLRPREQYVVRRRFGIEADRLSLREIARGMVNERTGDVGVDQSIPRVIQKKAFRKMRQDAHRRALDSILQRVGFVAENSRQIL